MPAVNYTLRLDEVDKQKAEQVFRALGMTFSTGINIYIKAVGRQQQIPFPLSINDTSTTGSLMNAFQALQKEAVQNGTSEMTIDEINAEITASRKEKRSS